MTRADLTADLPPVRVEPDARRRIRRALDDDPTGSQTVHGVEVVTGFELDELAAGLSEAGSTCFILTNTRSLPEADAVELNTRIGRMLFELADRLEAPEVIVGRRSRSRLVLARRRRSWSRSFGSMWGPTTATVPIELFGPQPPGPPAGLIILGENPGAVPCQDPLGGLFHADELPQRRHGPTCSQRLRSRCTLSPFERVDPDLRVCQVIQPRYCSLSRVPARWDVR